MLIPISTCSICQDKIVTNAKTNHSDDLLDVSATALHCGHMYHTGCILTWFKQKNSKRECPHCRTKVPMPWRELRPVVFDIPENCFSTNSDAPASLELASMREELQQVKDDTDKRVTQEREAVKSNYMTIIKQWKQKIDKYNDLKSKLLKAETDKKDITYRSEIKIKGLQEQVKHYQNREQVSSCFDEIKKGTNSSKYKSMDRPALIECVALLQNEVGMYTTKKRAYEDKLDDYKKELILSDQKNIKYRKRCKELEDEVERQSELYKEKYNLQEENLLLKKKISSRENNASKSSKPSAKKRKAVIDSDDDSESANSHHVTSKFQSSKSTNSKSAHLSPLPNTEFYSNKYSESESNADSWADEDDHPMVREALELDNKKSGNFGSKKSSFNLKPSNLKPSTFKHSFMKLKPKESSLVTSKTISGSKQSQVPKLSKQPSTSYSSYKPKLLQKQVSTNQPHFQNNTSKSSNQLTSTFKDQSEKDSLNRMEMLKTKLSKQISTEKNIANVEKKVSKESKVMNRFFSESNVKKRANPRTVPDREMMTFDLTNDSD